MFKEGHSHRMARHPLETRPHSEQQFPQQGEGSELESLLLSSPERDEGEGKGGEGSSHDPFKRQSLSGGTFCAFQFSWFWLRIPGKLHDLRGRLLPSSGW